MNKPRLRPPRVRLRLNLGLVCALLVLLPALLAAELVVRAYERRALEDIRSRTNTGLDSLAGLFDQERTRAINNAEVAAERLGPLVKAEAPAGDQLKVHMRHLREKLERNPSAPEYLLTLRGVGYKLTDRP